MTGSRQGNHPGGATSAAWVFLCAMLVLSAGCRQPQHQTPVQAPPEPNLRAIVDTLNAEIAALEFLNQLELSSTQATELYGALSTTAAEQVEAEKGRSALMEQLVVALNEKRGLLTGDKPVPAELQNRIADMQAKAATEAELNAGAGTELAGKIRTILDDQQLQIAAGGFEARIEAALILDGYRELRPEAFDADVTAFSQELASGVSDMSAQEVEALFREARALTDEEYSSGKRELVEQLLPLFAPPVESADWLLARAFLKPNVISLIRQRANVSAPAN